MGIEEEYLLVDPETRQLPSDEKRRQAVLDRVTELVDDSVGFATPEFLSVQVEVGTAVCHSIKDARKNLATLRRAVAQAAGEYGLAPIASSTHPMANWRDIAHTDKDRYNVLSNDMQTVAHRLLICGMHVHVGIESDDLRVDLLPQISYFLPHLLALTTSSPFWAGKNTGLKCYRLSIFDELPRTGLPERFDSWSEYQRHINILTGLDVIQDASKIWWDIRPHHHFPTLEMRIADICTNIDDGIAVASLYAGLVSMLVRLRRSNQKWREYSNMLIIENRWRAQRYGMDEGLIDFGLGQITPYPDLLEEIFNLCTEDFQRMDCVEEVARARTIVQRGTSAHRQVEIYEKSKESGASHEQALEAVVDWLIAETVNGL